MTNALFVTGTTWKRSETNSTVRCVRTVLVRAANKEYKMHVGTCPALSDLLWYMSSIIWSSVVHKNFELKNLSIFCNLKSSIICNRFENVQIQWRRSRSPPPPDFVVLGHPNVHSIKIFCGKFQTLHYVLLKESSILRNLRVTLPVIGRGGGRPFN
jgi:hypothetical protein